MKPGLRCLILSTALAVAQAQVSDQIRRATISGIGRHFGKMHNRGAGGHVGRSRCIWRLRASADPRGTTRFLDADGLFRPTAFQHVRLPFQGNRWAR